jgi:hypothetical protein
MGIKEIIEAVQAERVNITQHARKEAKEDNLVLDDVFSATCRGEIIEDYPTDAPYPSCLIYGETETGGVVHSVWAYAANSQIAVLITVYRPDPERWIDWKTRK